MEMVMANESAKESTSLEALSALADGELDDAESACARWCSDPAARASWHAYHLIGDVLRSADLASNAERDVVFLERVRAQLRAEPIALSGEPILVPGGIAPSADASAVARRPAARAVARLSAGVTTGRRRAWFGSAAVAAGFALVAGGVVLTRSPAPGTPVDDTIAQATSMAQATPVGARDAADVPDAAPLVIDGQLIRDARLDRYLAAHKQFAGSSALGLPSAFLHGAATDRPAR
jgi:sigma-E factor negative regulatory protein RseA